MLVPRLTHVRTLYGILAAVSISCFPSYAVGDGPLLTTVGTSLRDSTGMRGYSFDVGHELVVTGLAKFDGNRNGLLDDLVAPQIGIWNNQTSELILTDFIDETAVLRNDLFVKSIDPFVLPPGSYTVAVQTFSDQEPYIAGSDFESPTAVISSLKPERDTSTDFVFPDHRGNSLLGLGANLLVEQPLLTLAHPSGRVIKQRRADNLGSFSVAGGFDDSRVQSIEVRAVPLDGSNPTPWQSIATAGNQFTGQLEIPAGWYQVEARGVRDGESIGRASVSNIGVGEVFVIAGQSNSANHGQPAITPEDDRVLAMDADGNWSHAADPQPVATGNGGSPWPDFGDILAEQLDVPIGIVSVGWGGTTVGQWLPGANGPDGSPLYDRLQNALEILGPDGARAVLWHQGEGDALSATTQARYVDRLTQVIDESRKDAGFDIPWGIAKAAFQPGTRTSSIATVLAGQQEVIDSAQLVFAGPNTDDLGVEFRYDGIHFNEEGLRLHAEGWANAVLPLIATETSFLPADFNESGMVDFADFLFLSGQFGSSVAPAGTDPDIDGSGIVDLADFLVLSDTFGQSAAAVTAVPEPSALSLLILGGVLQGLVRRKRPDSIAA